MKYILFLLLIGGVSIHSKTNKESNSNIEEASKNAKVKSNKITAKNTQKNSAKKLASYEETQLMVLQWTVSHLRNTDQISLIFKQGSVEMVTNTSSWQKDSPLLGRFSSRYTDHLTALKEQVGEYYTEWTNTVPVSSLINIEGFPIKEIDPHAPVLSLAGEAVPKNHPYFEPLSNIIYSIWENKWSCIECASYQKKRNSIVRTVTSSTLPEGRRKTPTTKKVRKTFSKAQLECIPKEEGQDDIECVDPEFGIFEL